MLRVCEVCGRQTDTVKTTRVFVTNFGNRSQVEKLACRNCREAEAKGEL